MIDIQEDARGLPRCRNCGAPVSHRFCRVFGDNQDEVYGCIRCTSLRDLTQGGGTRN